MIFKGVLEGEPFEYKVESTDLEFLPEPTEFELMAAARVLILKHVIHNANREAWVHRKDPGWYRKLSRS